MYAFWFALGVAGFVLAMLISIALHEVGHLVPARAFGGRVTQFFVGFGRTLWSRRVGDTEYGIKAIPLGGFVRIVGMLPPARQPDPPTFMGQLMADARAADQNQITTADEGRLFYQFSWWKRVITMAGGPMVNLAIAWAVFTAIFATVGNFEDPEMEPVVADLALCVIPFEEEGRECAPGDPKTPALEAGLKPGDRLVSFNGEPIDSWPEMQQLIRGNGEKEATIVVDRAGEEVALTTTTVVERRPTEPGDDTLREVGFLGVYPVAKPTVGGPIYTASQMGGMIVDAVSAIGQMPVKVYHVGLAIAGVEERDPNGPISLVGGGRLVGEAAASDELSAQQTWILLGSFVAGFNLFLGIFNLLPLLPLDGGHVAGALYEAVRRAWARLFGRPDPGHADIAKLIPVAYIVAAAMVVMGSVLIVADLVVPIKLT